MGFVSEKGARTGAVNGRRPHALQQPSDVHIDVQTVIKMHVESFDQGRRCVFENLLQHQQRQENANNDESQCALKRPCRILYRQHAALKGQLEQGMQAEIGDADNAAQPHATQQECAVAHHAGRLQQQLAYSDGDNGARGDQGRLCPGGDAEGGSHTYRNETTGSQGDDQASGLEVAGTARHSGCPEGVHAAAGGEEGVGFVQGVSHQVQHGQTVEAEAALQQHETHLRAGGPGQRHLDAGLGEHHQGSQGQGGEADHRQGAQGDFRMRHHGAHADDQEGAGVDDAGMQQGGYRRGRLHHLDQPAVEGKLSGFEDSAQHDQHRRPLQGQR